MIALTPWPALDLFLNGLLVGGGLDVGCVDHRAAPLPRMNRSTKADVRAFVAFLTLVGLGCLIGIMVRR